MQSFTIEDVADSAYEAALGGENGWNAVMAKLRTLTGSADAAFVNFDPVSRRSHIFFGGCEPGYNERFQDPQLSNPILPFLARSAPTVLFTEQSVLPKHEFRRTTFFNEWLVPQGMRSFLGLHTTAKDGSSLLIALLRGGDTPFDRQEAGLLDRLAPTLLRAAGLSLRLTDWRLHAEAQAWDALAIACFVVDASCRPLAMNERAEALLTNRGCGLLMLGGRISAASKSEADGLRLLVASACADAVGTVPRSGEMLLRSPATQRASLALTVAPFAGEAAGGLPVPRAAMILVQDLTARQDGRLAERLRTLFGFTPKETELAVALLAGLSVKEHAQRQSVSFDTARTHLQHLFGKTQTTRQSELVALLGRVARLPF